MDNIEWYRGEGSQEDIEWLLSDITQVIRRLNKGYGMQDTNIKFLDVHTFEVAYYLKDEYKPWFYRAVSNELQDKQVKQAFQDKYGKLIRQGIINNILD